MTATNKPSGRLLSLDVMRGITIAGMILVNNPGSWSHIYAPFRHAEWNGLTPTDLVFPFFMFIMGVSTFFSLKKYDFKYSAAACYKIIRRTVLLFLISWGIMWFARSWTGLLDPEKTFWEAITNFADMRALGVFPRLALCYCVTAFVALFLRPKHIKWVVAAFLVIYAVILLVGNGYVFSEENILVLFDRFFLGENHMYHDTVDGLTLAFDPEGLLSTLPSIAHCMIGFLCGDMLMRIKDNRERSYNLFIIGAILTMSGFLLSYGLPINKKVWSPTFVLTTCGLGSSLLALLIWMIDIKGWKGRATGFFETFGINPLFLYVMSTLLAISMARIKWDVLVDGVAQKISLWGFAYRDIMIPLCDLVNDVFGFGIDSETMGSLLMAISFVLINWCIGLILYKKKIYIKI